VRDELATPVLGPHRREQREGLTRTSFRWLGHDRRASPTFAE
jgi:hypothetical protein